MRKNEWIGHRRLLTASVLALLGSAPLSALACVESGSVYVGTICTVAYDWCPSGYLPANGQILPISSNQVLYSLLGVRFGGDGRTNFGLPDLRGRAMIAPGMPVDANNNPVGTTVPFAAKVGQQSLTLTPAQTGVAPHTHTAQFTAVTTPASVQIPATQGDLKVSAALPVSTSVGTVTGAMADLASGQTGYLAGLSGLAGSSAVKFTGPYTTTAPGSASAASLPANVNVSGTAPTAATTATITTVTGGSVAVGTTTQSATQAVSTQTPSLAVTVCIASTGLYPSRP